jgi:hypothetical protein
LRAAALPLQLGFLVFQLGVGGDGVAGAIVQVRGPFPFRTYAAAV